MKPQILADRLAAVESTVVSLFLKLSPDQWNQVIYPGPPAWTPRHIIAHFISAEAGKYRLLEQLLSGSEGVPEGFDIDGYNAEHVDAWLNISNTDLLDQFKTLRGHTVDFVRSLPVDSLSITGRDPYLGIAPLEEIIKLIYLHNQIHVRDLRSLIIC
jgi:hypothetical protein